MSVLVSGPRRVFVMLVSVGALPPLPHARWGAPGWRETVWIRLQRVPCGRLVGLQLLVLEPDVERPRP